MGMGRGAGNLKLEDFIKSGIQSKFKLKKIKNFNNRFMIPLKKNLIGDQAIYTNFQQKILFIQHMFKDC